MGFIKILLICLHVCFGLAFLCLLLHYLYLLESRSKLQNTSSLFDRAFFIHQRAYYFVGDSTLVLGKRSSKRLSSRSDRLDEKYISSALDDGLLELFSSNRFFPGNIVLRSESAYDLHFNSFNKYEVLRIDASAVIPGEVYLTLDFNQTIMRITLPPTRSLSVIDIQYCNDLETVKFTGPPPAYMNSEPDRPVIRHVSQDFCFTVPYKYLEDYKKSSLSKLFFTDDQNEKFPITFWCDDPPADEDEPLIPDDNYWRI